MALRLVHVLRAAGGTERPQALDVVGGEDWAALQGVLRHKCGNLYCAWRTVLDPTDRGKIGFNEFANCCREVQRWAHLLATGNCNSY